MIVTFDFTFCNFMFGLLIDNKSSLAVTNEIVRLKTDLHNAGLKFCDVIPLLLTDNGGEFSNVFSFENGLDGLPETKLFFCDPCQSSQKPHVEKTIFRDIMPKGYSFDGLTQEKLNAIFSHVNSIKRKSLNGKSPYDLFVFTFGQKIADILGITEILPENVIQSPKLLKKI